MSAPSPETDVSVNGSFAPEAVVHPDLVLNASASPNRARPTRNLLSPQRGLQLAAAPTQATPDGHGSVGANSTLIPL
jgi:hypothetical protein